MGLGLAWFAAAVLATAWAPQQLITPHIAPSVIALTHAWVLGFFVTIAVGAIYQLAPVALSTTLWSERGGWWHFALHAAAVPVMVYAFWHWNLPLLGAAGSFVVAGVLLFAGNTLVTIVRSGKRDAVAWSLILATLWLVLTVTAGLALVANRLWHLWPTDPLPLLRAHAHLGLAGFFLTLLQGVTFRLVPMFTLGDVPHWRPVRIGLWLSQLGLLGLAPALAWHVGYASAVFGMAIVAGLVFSGIALRQTFATRKKRHLDVGLQALVRGMIGLGLASVAGIWLVWPTTAAGSAPGGFSANVYGVLVLLGGLLPAIAGMMNKIVPFLTWMRAYGPKVGRMPTPPASALANSRLEAWGLGLQGLALLPLLVGTWLVEPLWLRLGTLLLALGTALFLANQLLVLKHLFRPQPPTPAKPKSPPKP
ncbi:hypothetical protein DB354_05105 [Opitutus sp. ER46]|nr:hypothetical protein DB354_05105 [Opitutus sp. ER46]